MRKCPLACSARWNDASLPVIARGANVYTGFPVAQASEIMFTESGVTTMRSAQARMPA